MRFLSLVFLPLVISAASLCSAQVSESNASIGAGVRYRLAGVTDVQKFGDLLIVDKAKESSVEFKAVGIVKAITKDPSTKVKIRASNGNREPVEVRKLSDGYWIIEATGKVWVEVTVFDFKKDLFEDESFVLDIGGGDSPGPGPNPPGPVPPNDDVPNKYALGAAAYKNAPREAAAVREYARIYREAADFLYGKPTAKKICVSTDPDYADPAKSVLAWVVQQQNNVQSSNKAGWDKWRQVMSDALRESQIKQKQYTREDWFAALNEISKGLEAIK